MSVVQFLQVENREGDGIFMSLLSSMAISQLSSFLFHLAKD